MSDIPTKKAGINFTHPVFSKVAESAAKELCDGGHVAGTEPPSFVSLSLTGVEAVQLSGFTGKELSPTVGRRASGRKKK